MMFLSFIFFFNFVSGKSIEIRYSSMLEVVMRCDAMQCNAIVMSMEDGR